MDKIMEHAEFTVDVLDSVTGEDARQIWEDYDASYREYNLRTPVRQSLREQDFLAALAESAFKKVVVRDASGETVAVAICTFQLVRLPWISADFFEHNFPAERGRILYVAGMYVKPGKRGVKASQPLMLGIRQLVRNQGGNLVGFDCSLRLQAWLPELVMRATGGRPIHGHFECGEVDRQGYYLLQEVHDEQTQT